MINTRQTRQIPGRYPADPILPGIDITAGQRPFSGHEYPADPADPADFAYVTLLGEVQRERPLMIMPSLSSSSHAFIVVLLPGLPGIRRSEAVSAGYFCWVLPGICRVCRVLDLHSDTK